jgi:uncharacterized membrane protein
MRKLLTAVTALSLIAAPTASAMAQSRAPAQTEDASNMGDEGLFASPIVIIAGIAVLVLFYFLVIKDDDDEPESP